MQLATVFSGIGGPEQACRKVFGQTGFSVLFACDNGEREIPQSEDEILASTKGMTEDEKQDFIENLYLKRGENKMKKSYLANYQIKTKWYEDIRFIDGFKYSGQVDLFVGGSPCQSFSNMGHRKGLEDARGTLFFNFADLIDKIQPKVFVYENVPGMMTIDNGDTWVRILKILDSLNYSISPTLLDASKYGIPQKRSRLYVVGIRKDVRQEKFIFPEGNYPATTVRDFLEKKVDPKYYFKKVGFRFVTTHPGRARINRDIIGTERANQQFNWNGDFVFEKYNAKKHKAAIENGAEVGDWRGQKGLIRKMTPRECLNLMGFGDFNIVVDDHTMWRQTGNSMVVNVMESIIKKLHEEGVI